jgi:hypothetical protein
VCLLCRGHILAVPVFLGFPCGRGSVDFEGKIYILHWVRTLSAAPLSVCRTAFMELPLFWAVGVSYIACLSSCGGILAAPVFLGFPCGRGLVDFEGKIHILHWVRTLSAAPLSVCLAAFMELPLFWAVGVSYTARHLYVIYLLNGI